MDQAVMTPDYALNDGKPRSAAGELSREKRIKDIRGDFLWNPASGVGDTQTDVLTCGQIWSISARRLWAD